MNKPETEYVLIRTSRYKSILKLFVTKSVDFDFTGYSFWRMSPDSTIPIEEWVPSDELEIYKKIRAIL